MRVLLVLDWTFYRGTYDPVNLPVKNWLTFHLLLIGLILTIRERGYYLSPKG